MDTTSVESMFDTFETEAFRLEALPRYCVEPEYSMFLKWLGDGVPPDRPAFDEWSEQLQQSRARGLSIVRVRACPLPKDQFVEFESHFLRMNAAMGEQIYMLEQEINFPDFWLFDEIAVAFLRYDDEGRYIGTDLSEDPQVVGECVATKRQVLADARLLQV